MADATPAVIPTPPPDVQPVLPPGTIVLPPPPPLPAPPEPVVPVAVAPVAPNVRLTGLVLNLGDAYPLQANILFYTSAAQLRLVTLKTICLIGTIDVPDPGKTRTGQPNAYSVLMAATATCADSRNSPVTCTYYDSYAFPYQPTYLVFTQAAAGVEWRFFVRDAGPGAVPPGRDFDPGTWAVTLSVTVTDRVNNVAHSQTYPLPDCVIS